VKDSRVEVRFRNELILARMEQLKIKSVAELCRKMKKPRAQGFVADLINLRRSPLCVDSDIQVPKWTKTAERLARALKCSPEQLFTEEQVRAACRPNKNRKYHFAISALDIPQLVEGARRLALPADVLLQEEQTRIGVEEAVRGAIAFLRPREAEVLERCVMGGETLKDVASEKGMTGERLRQIQSRALARLRRASVARRLRIAASGN